LQWYGTVLGQIYLVARAFIVIKHNMTRQILWMSAMGIFFFCQTVSGQMRGWELGGFVGGANYFGDLNTNFRINRIQPAGGIAARFNFNDRLAVRLGFHGGRIEAYDSDATNIFERRRNLSFRSPIADGTFQLEFNFMPYIHGHREFYYSPYMFAGPSFFLFNPRTQVDGTWYNLRDFGTEGQFRGEEYNSFQGAIAYGFGFKMDFSYRWSMNIELSARRVFTDYIDDVSGVYPDMRDLRSLRGDEAVRLSDRSEEPKLGEAGRQRGNGKKNDAYAFITVGAFYYFGNVRCPSISR
jgi:hypothetical protein